MCRGQARIQMRLSTLPPILLLVCLSACAQLGGSDGAPQVLSASKAHSLHQRNWDLEGLTVEGRQIVMDVDARMTIRFDSAGQVGGLAGVNRYSGSYSLTAEGKLSWGKPGFAITRRTGLPEVMEKERAYLQALGNVDVAILAGRTLLLQSDDESTVLTFKEAGR